MTVTKTTVVGAELAAVMPKLQKPWYLTPHLASLNGFLLVVLFSSAGLGFDGSMMNGLQSLSTWTTYFHNPSAGQLGVINGVLNLGPILFGGPAAWLSDRIGRRRCIQVGNIILIASCIIQASAQKVAQFAVGRFFIGVGLEFCAIASPVLITELAYPTHRAKVTSLYNTFFFVGAIFSSWATFGTFKMKTSWGWRIPSLLQVFVPCIQFVCLFFIPESPRWLVGKGRVEAARAILVKHHAGGQEESPLVDFEIHEITGHLLQQREVAAMGWPKLWQTRADKKRLAIVIYIAFMSQWAGNGLISYYLSLILNSIGIRASFDKTLINGILQIFNFASAIFGALLVDRMGRRPLWLWSIAGMFVSYIVWTACSAVYASTSSKASAMAVLVLIFIYQFHYAIAITPFSFSYPVEILPFQNRQKGMAISYICNSLANLFNSFASPVAITAIGWKYYIVYIVLLAQFLVVAYLFFPETRGHSLEQIGHLFESKALTGRNRAGPPTSLEDGKVDDLDKGVATKHVERVSIDEKVDRVIDDK